jgi:hypothetical protein
MNDQAKMPLEKHAIPEELKAGRKRIVHLMGMVLHVHVGLIVKADAPGL